MVAGKDLSGTLTKALKSLQSEVPAVIGLALVSLDGFPIVSELSRSIEEREVSTLSVAMAALSEQTASSLGHDGVERIFVEGTKGYIVITSAGPEAVLIAIADKDVTLGIIFMEIGRAVETVKEAMMEWEETNRVRMP